MKKKKNFSTSLLKMDSTTKIPDRKDFYSKIQEKSISVEEHKFASRMWNLYEIKKSIGVLCIILRD